MDISYLLFLQSLRESTNGIFDKFFAYVTTYGEMAGLFALFCIVYWCINKKAGEYMLLSLSFSRIINGFLKVAFCVYRPWIRDARVIPMGGGTKTATGYSFPSGHTTNATACFGGFALNGGCHKALTVVLWICALLVGFSRNYIGVHTPQDVIVAFTVTTLVIIGTQKLLDKFYDKPNSDFWIVGFGLLACVLTLLYTVYKSYPMDYDSAGKIIVDPAKMVLDSYKNLGYCFGILLGWIIEKRFINFSVEGTAQQRIMRFIICFALFQILVLIINPAIVAHMSKEVGGFFKPFMQMLYIGCIAPAIIKYAKL